MFVTIQKMINKFVLMNKFSRFSHKILTTYTSNLGLGVPEIENYYKATILEQSREIWTQDLSKQWVEIEQDQLPVKSFRSVLESRLNWKISPNISNPITANTILIWREFTKLCSNDPLARSTPIPLINLSTALKNLPLENWIDQGIKSIDDLLVGTEIKTFEELVLSYNIPESDKPKYLKIHKFLSKYPSTPISILPQINKLLDPQNKI
ncbi:hypothetical protein XELAEV_18020164mg [Xenopus laevis]|uniref:Uncharacterized protein n=1 Tax=Xenopus laevis TaxID=8355 RepID=A0A974HQF7_XENLA|nr:hypothetical protein XELAEV_18020164mg [Xenopus laevis]